MTERLDIGIVGCGFAGAAVALFLARDEHRVTIYEEAAEPRAIGAGIVLQPTGMSVLAGLGLAGAVLERGAPLDSLHCRSAIGRTLIELRYAELARHAFGLGMHRGALFEILYGALARTGVKVVCGAPVQALEARGAERYVVCRGERGAPHDLVIVADGARSALREPALTRRARPYPWGALWFVARDPERVYGRTLHQVADGTRRFVGFLPTGLGPESTSDGTPLVSLFYSVRMDAVSDLAARGLDAFKREVLSFDSRADFVLDQIERFDELLPSGYLDVVMSAWHGDRVAYLGDAAHAMSPQLGQGCNLALLDASALAASLREHERLEDALAAFTLRRRPQLAYYQLATRWLTPFFQSDHAALGALRDVFMALAFRIGPIRRQMLATMAGIKRGIVRPGLPIERVLAALPPAPLALSAGRPRP